jgi:hypothetical protein
MDTESTQQAPRLRTAARVFISVGLLIATFAAPAAVRAGSGDDVAPPIHWAYGAFLGTGAYRISGDRAAFLLQIPARWTARRSGFDEDGKRRFGLELRFPLTLGVLRPDSTSGYIDQETYGTVSLTPGLELEFPLTHDWLLRPFFAVGWGTELGPDDVSAIKHSALIYQAGLKSRYRLPTDLGTWAVLAGVQFAGYNPDVGDSSGLLVITGGLETRQRLFQMFIGPNPLFIEAHAIYNYVNDLNERGNRAPAPVGVDDFWEVGLSVSQGVVPFRILRIPIERIGIALQMGTNTDYRAIKLSFRSLFRK